jgi:hypothetical protein
LDKVKVQYIKMRLELERKQLKEILPEQFREKFERYAFIAGGCIYSLYNNQDPKDIDFFVKNEVFAHELRKYFLSQAEYKSKTTVGGMYNGYSLTVTDNAISLGKYQIITRWIGEPAHVVGEFDFAHNQFYYENDEIGTESDFDALDSNELRYNEKRARDICGTLARVPKFVKRGMVITQKEMAKMLLKLKEVGFTDKEVSVLEECKEKNESEHFGS